MDLAQLADRQMQTSDYAAAIATYEQAIAHDPRDRSLYWPYGMALLLAGQSTAAQITWMTVLMDAGEAEPQWRGELYAIFTTQAMRSAQSGDLATTALIRAHWRELDPQNIPNLLHLIKVMIDAQTLDVELFQQLGIIEALQVDTAMSIDQPFLFYILESYLNHALIHPVTIDFVSSLIPYVINTQEFVDLIRAHANRIAYSQNHKALAHQLVTVSLTVLPHDFESLLVLALLSEQQDDYASARQLAIQASDHASTLVEKISASRTMLQIYLSSGQWSRQIPTQIEQLQQHINLLIQQSPTLDRSDSYRVMLSAMHYPYFTDQPDHYRNLQHQLSGLCERGLQHYHQALYDRHQAAHRNGRNQSQDADRPVKIGYLCRYFHRHSVGWLARWLLKNHDPEVVEVYIYLLNPQLTPDSVQQQYLQIAPHIRGCSLDATEIVAQIHQDGIEILVELDSLTCQVTCEVMALKPAPIQVSWLGWDATGMSSIDYFIADPYVLPESAQDYYSEKIIRLPQAYIAVEGFEVGVPTLHRSQFNLPADAILFMSAQRGYKRHPAMMQLQLQILQQVPNSYLLIKGLADQAMIQTAFWDLATAMGLSHDRLIFLPIVDNEEIHRANLAIADVILDTYPYNGATTTLEALWMERPLVTRVGSQFAARNSYTMLKNVGIETGIAWTDAEYVEWGIRLGTDATLRQQVSWQLRQAKQTAPLWNAAQFARDMEGVYKTMWQQFQQQPAN